MKKINLIKGLGVCTIICLIGIAAYLGYVIRLGNYSVNSVYISLAETAAQQRFNIDQELNTDVEILLDVAVYLGKNMTAPAQNKVLLESLVGKTHFKTLNYFEMDGTQALEAGHAIHVPGAALLEKEIENRTVAYETMVNEENIFLMYTPVFDVASNRLGMLIGAHEVTQLKRVLLPFFHGEGITYIVSKSTGLVLSSLPPESMVDFDWKNKDFWDIMLDTKHLGYDTVLQVRENVQENKSGSMIYRLNHQKRYAYYEPVGMSDWYVFTVVGDQAVAPHRDLVLFSAFVLTLIMTATFALLIFYILWQQYKHNTLLEHVAYYDELCKCPNLQKFKLTSQQFINQHHDEKFAMIKLDIDRFKLVNQTLGIEAGDMILQKLADALKENAENDECRFARAHDDEFYILQRYQERSELTKLRHSFYNGFLSRMGGDFRYRLRFISGIYFMSLENCSSAVDAIEKANVAHQKAKANGLELCIYDETFTKDALRKKSIEERMESALKAQEFQVYFQAQYSLHTNAPIGAEALVRWNIDNGEKIYPDEFIPLFEENNFILQLDMYMFEKVSYFIRSWIDRGLVPVMVSVNFARNHLANENFVEDLCAIADRYQIPHQLLEVELTERVIAQGEELSLRLLEDLHQKGFALAMDDFGTGYSSLGLLKNTPVDVIKIDKSFFDNADDQPRTKAVLRNVLRLAKDLHAYTVAEGVETEGTVNLLRDLGCDAIQGYYYGRPVEEPEFIRILRSSTQKSI